MLVVKHSIGWKKTPSQKCPHCSKRYSGGARERATPAQARQVQTMLHQGQTEQQRHRKCSRNKARTCQIRARLKSKRCWMLRLLKMPRPLECSRRSRVSSARQEHMVLHPCTPYNGSGCMTNTHQHSPPRKPPLSRSEVSRSQHEPAQPTCRHPWEPLWMEGRKECSARTQANGTQRVRLSHWKLRKKSRAWRRMRLQRYTTMSLSIILISYFLLRFPSLMALHTGAATAGSTGTPARSKRHADATASRRTAAGMALQHRPEIRQRILLHQRTECHAVDPPCRLLPRQLSGAAACAYFHFLGAITGKQARAGSSPRRRPKRESASCS